MVRLVSNPFDYDHLTFEEFRQQLESVPVEIGIMMADEALLLYESYKAHGLTVPFVREGGSYQGPHVKVQGWMEDGFRKMIEQRLIQHSFNQDSIAGHVSGFLGFRDKMGRLFTIYSDGPQDTGRLGLEDMLNVLRKLFRLQRLEPDAIDEVINTFSPGSALFLSELYLALATDVSNHILLDSIRSLTMAEAMRLLRAPVLMQTPWNHQSEAFERWSRNGGGIIEMATGTGKTLLGIMAIEDMVHHKSGGHVVIMAHSRAILNQWRRSVIDNLGIKDNPDASFERPLQVGGVLVEFRTVQATLQRLESILQNETSPDILIVDEVHHSASTEFKKAASIPAGMKMGLSATIEGMRRDILQNEMGKVCYTYTIRQAIDDGIIPDFDWKLHTTNLSVPEEKEFKELSRSIVRSFSAISSQKEAIREVAGKDFALRKLSDFVYLMKLASIRKIRTPDDWKVLQSKLFSRRRIINRSGPKLDRALEIAKAKGNSEKVIIFTMDIATCEDLAARLRPYVRNVLVVHSELSGDLPTRRIEEFKRSPNGILIGAKMLDEGIDIPDARIGINVASSRTKLQMVQRLGRILRRHKQERPEFHHLIAVPAKDELVEGEDTVTFLEDLSWAQDIAMKMGISAELIEDDELAEIRSMAEAEFKYDLENVGRAPYMETGTFRLKSVLDQLDPSQRISLCDILSEREGRIEDTEWQDILRESRACAEDRAVPMGMWWLLIASGREPVRLRELLESGIESNPTMVPILPEEEADLEDMDSLFDTIIEDLELEEYEKCGPGLYRSGIRNIHVVGDSSRDANGSLHTFSLDESRVDTLDESTDIIILCCGDFEDDYLMMPLKLLRAIERKDLIMKTDGGMHLNVLSTPDGCFLSFEDAQLDVSILHCEHDPTEAMGKSRYIINNIALSLIPKSKPLPDDDSDGRLNGLVQGSLEWKSEVCSLLDSEHKESMMKGLRMLEDHPVPGLRNAILSKIKGRDPDVALAALRSFRFVSDERDVKFIRGLLDGPRSQMIEEAKKCLHCLGYPEEDTSAVNEDEVEGEGQMNPVMVTDLAELSKKGRDEKLRFLRDVESFIFGGYLNH